MNSKCYLCGSTESEKIEGIVRDYEHLKILRCKNCGLVYLDSFDHIDETYYENSKMLSEAHLSIEKWSKENYEQNQKRAEWLTPLATNKLVLDFGCGEGGFLKNIKPVVKACAGVEKSKIMRERIVREYGIQAFAEIEDVKGQFDLITLFHVIEHLKDPVEYLKKFNEHLAKDGNIIIETPNINDALLSYYTSKAFANFTFWGCHLYLFSAETLRTTLEKAGYKVNYVRQIQRYPLSNHLYWLAYGKPNGHKIWEGLNNPTLNSAYEATLASLGICDTIVASVTKG